MLPLLLTLAFGGKQGPHSWTRLASSPLLARPARSFRTSEPKTDRHTEIHIRLPTYLHLQAHTYIHALWLRGFRRNERWKAKKHQNKEKSESDRREWREREGERTREERGEGRKEWQRQRKTRIERRHVDLSPSNFKLNTPIVYTIAIARLPVRKDITKGNLNNQPRKRTKVQDHVQKRDICRKRKNPSKKDSPSL